MVNPLTVTSVGQENTRYIRTQSQKRTGISIEPDERCKEQVAELIAFANGHDVVVRAVIVRLFPVGQQYMPRAGTHPHVGSDDSRYGEEWAAKRLQERRVVHEHILRVYLEHVAGDDLLALDRAATEFAKHVQQQIRSAPVDDLIVERDLLRVLGLAKSSIEPTRDPFDIPESPKLTLVLLRSADIQTLSILYGDEATMGARFEELKQQFEDLKPWIESKGIPLDEAEQLLDTADNYKAELRKTTFPIPIPPNS